MLLMEVHYTGQVVVEADLIQIPLGLVELAEEAEVVIVMEDLQGLAADRL
jgi:hypothetical protein